MSAPDADQVASPSKRNRRKAAARDRWSEEQLLTSEKSELIGKDLVVWIYLAGFSVLYASSNTCLEASS